MVKYCSMCGNPVEPGGRFCTNCGAKISEVKISEAGNETADENEVSKENEAAEINKHVHKKVSEDNNSRAGENLSADKKQPEKKSENSKKPMALVIVLVALAVIIAIIAVCLDSCSSEEADEVNAPDDTQQVQVEEGPVGEAVMNINWYHTVEMEDGSGTEHCLFSFGDDGILEFRNWQDETSYSIEGDSLEYTFTETEEENIWTLDYSGSLVYEEDNDSDTYTCSGKIKCEYDPDLKIIKMVPLSGELLEGYSEERPFVLAADESDVLSVEYDYRQEVNENENEKDSSLTYSEAESISAGILNEYYDAYIEDFNSDRYNRLSSVVEEGSSFENSKISWIKQCNYYEKIISHDTDSVSVISDTSIQATCTETYFVYGQEGGRDYYITQRATYIIDKQSDGDWKISSYKGGVKDINKEYAE